MKKKVSILLFVIFSAVLCMAQATFQPPIVTAGATTAISWTAGTVNNGGHPVAVAAGSSTVTLNKADCSAPGYAACNFVIANSSGTVSVTLSPAAAVATGNTLLAMIETGATTTTQIVYPWQSGTLWLAPAGMTSFSSIPTTLQQPPQVVFLTGSAYTNATTTFSNVTGLAFSVLATTNYHATCHIYWQGSAATSGPKYQFTGPGSPTAVVSGMISRITATTDTSAVVTAFSTPLANGGTITTATNFVDLVDIGLVNGANAGTVQLQAASNGAGTLTIQPGSYCSVQ